MKLRTKQGLVQIERSDYYPDLVLTVPAGLKPVMERLTTRTVRIKLVADRPKQDA